MTTPEDIHIPEDPRKKQNPVLIAVKLNGTVTHVEDLPLEAVDQIAKQYGVPWLRVLSSPMSDLAMARAIVDAVGVHIGYTVPPMSVRQLAEVFTTVPDDVPDPDYIIDTKDDDDDDPFRGGVGT